MLYILPTQFQPNLKGRYILCVYEVTFDEKICNTVFEVNILIANVVMPIPGPLIRDGGNPYPSYHLGVWIFPPSLMGSQYRYIITSSLNSNSRKLP